MNGLIHSWINGLVDQGLHQEGPCYNSEGGTSYDSLNCLKETVQSPPARKPPLNTTLKQLLL